MTELTCKILTEKYMYQKMWIYTILEYTLSNLLKYSLLTIDIKKCTTKKKKKKNILTDRKYHYWKNKKVIIDYYYCW